MFATKQEFNDAFNKCYYDDCLPIEFRKRNCIYNQHKVKGITDTVKAITQKFSGNRLSDDDLIIYLYKNRSKECLTFCPMTQTAADSMRELIDFIIDYTHKDDSFFAACCDDKPTPPPINDPLLRKFMDQIEDCTMNLRIR